MFNVLWGKNLNQSSISNAQVKCAVGEEGRLSFRNAVAVLAIVFCLHSNNSAAVTDDNIPFKIPQQRADTALTLFAEQANLTLVFPFDQVKDITANRLVGNYPIDTAINILLQDTGLMPTFSNQLVLNIAIDDKGKSMNKNTRKTLLASMVGLFAAGGLSTAAAQETESARAQGVLDEIIVTATKRATSLNDTAVSVAALAGDEVTKRNLSGADDYLRFIPGVNILNQGPNRSPIIVRGIASDPQSESVRSGASVGSYFGEVPLSGLGYLGGTTDLRLVDLERIEVLRGPQGTLFGSSSLGGTVRNIPTAPKLDVVEGSLKADISHTAKNGSSNHKVEGVLNLPLIQDVLAIRAVAYKHDNSGYIKNVAGSHPTFADVAETVGAGSLAIDENDIGATEYTGGRLTALWRATDSLDITLSYVKQDGEMVGFGNEQLDLEPYTQTRFQSGDLTFIDGLEGNSLGLDGEGSIDNISFTNLVMEYDFGSAQLLSSSFWFDGESALGFDLASFVGGFPVAFPNGQDTDSFVQEVRLSSSLDGPVQYIAGLFYEKIDAFFESPGHWTGDVALYDDDFFGPIPAPFGAVSQFDYNVEDKSVKQKAIFGEVSYEFTEKMELTLGGRWFEYERDNNLGGVGIFTGSPFEIANLKSKESGANYKVNMSYRPDDDTLIYGQWAEGFRLGNTQDRLPSFCDGDEDGIFDGTGLPITDSFDSDTLENFELGSKLTLLDNRLQVNASAYRINWQGIPLTVVSPTCFFGLVVNAGEARSQGIEIETVYQVSPELRLSLSGGYVNAELTQDAEGLGDDGDRLPGVPDYNIGVGIEYELQLAGYPSYIKADYAHVGGFYNNLQELGTEAGDYGQLNLNMGMSIGNLSLSLYAENLTNEDSYTWIDSTLTADARAHRLRPRTIGFGLGYSF